MSIEKKWTYAEIQADQLVALDLRIEANSSNEEMHAYRITIEESPEKAEALYLVEGQRLGIAWGADATWADVDGVESGIDMWVNDGAEWQRWN